MHSLEPLQYAFQPGQALIFTEPTVCMGALWLPYRRNSATMKAILSSAELLSYRNQFDTGKNSRNGTKTSTNHVRNGSTTATPTTNPSSKTMTNINHDISHIHEKISVIFCHADVKGAFMNDNIRSKEGLAVSLFPSKMRIFSGHFHKPHTISTLDKSIRYV